ncbi:holo-ACP synthase [Candidatus Phytoplasma solani]|uniref:Holo-[acyl-carrier-protein] synthase n=1 Tax=Candidatus Phytoplasma solani TaxID=69896 RepID=A0A421NY82_9MOLU|nr:holo-ACP synthase [Candidatus Phytoplasma solani]RMI88975.1 holo-[acyl-carrier-protein] synthase [Candidatus Phytoplasma solani]CCP88165.1 Holo-[acyl-carrier-protein] synthase [Candidatus Phytoplasma solani]CCP88853.1 4'-phosphopantetheinyl transferase [Candidatus Phytoplasma solani]
MNIQNIGIDLVEIKKIQNIGIEKLAARVLSDQEKKVFQTFCHLERQLTFLAGRWAAKEALFKAFQTQAKLNYSKTNYCDWSILNDQNGVPYLADDRFKNQVLLSLSHTSNYAVAIVVVLLKEIKK